MAKDKQKGMNPEQAHIAGIQAHLDNKDFVKFLDQYDDDIDIDDPASAEILEQRFSTFELSRQAGPEIKKFYQDRIQADLGIKLTDKEMAEVSEYAQKEAIENPEAIQELMTAIEELQQSEVLIEGREEELESLIQESGGARRLRLKQARLEAADRKGLERIPLLRRFVRPTEDQQQARDIVREVYKLEAGDIGAAREKVGNAQRKIEKYERVQTLRERVFKETGVARVVYEKARSKAQEKIKQLADPERPMSDWQKALDEIADLRKLSKNAPIDYLGDYDQKIIQGENTEHLNAEQTEEWLETRIDGYIGTQVEDLMKKHETYSSFERAMEKVVGAERIGRRSGQEKNDFIRSTLEALLPKVTLGRKLFLKTYLATFNKEA
jgi:hypothetical protein